MFVALPVNRLELDLRRIELLPNQGIEEVGTAVVALQYVPFRLPRDRRQLMHVADQQDLYVAERLAILADGAQNQVDRIERVTTHHADLIDDEQVHLPKHLQFFPAQAMLAQQPMTVRRDIQ